MHPSGEFVPILLVIFPLGHGEQNVCPVSS